MNVQYQNFFAEQTVARLPNVLTAEGRRNGRRMATETAEARSRRNVYHARSKLIMTALGRFTALLYETVEGGSHLLANVDTSARILIASPWSWRHSHSYGLNRTDADVLRWEMLGRCLPELDHTPLCLYENHAWYIDLSAYPTEADALRYWKDHPVTASTLAGFERARGA